MYGDTPTLPKREDMPTRPLSPYALQKLVGEQYCQMFTQLYGFETVTTRYFNVFGPRQDPASPYSGVLSKFCTAFLEQTEPVVFGDGEQTRDFTYIENVVQANLSACEAPGASGRAINVGTGDRISLNQTLQLLREISGNSLEAKYDPAREGDIRDSQADLIYHDVMMIGRDGQRWREFSGPPPLDPYRGLLLGNNFLATTAVTIRRSCVASAGGFDCNPEFEICEDYELWLRLARAGAKFAYIPEVLAEIARSDGSLSSNVSRHNRNRLNVRRHCLQQACDEGILSPAEFKRHGYRVAAKCYAGIAVDQARQRHLIGAIRAAVTAAAACFQIVLRGDWEMIGQLARAVLRRLAEQLHL